MDELEIIKKLARSFPDASLGDDTAVIAPREGDILFTSDAVAEGVHFRREYCSPGQAVQKVITSNVSDIYAMGGRPDEFVFTAGLPAGCSAGDVDDIIEGAKIGSEVYQVKLAGGDTVRTGGGLFFDISMLGRMDGHRVINRSGAREGDLMVLFGECGRSLAGLGLLAELWKIDLPRPVPPVNTPSGWKGRVVKDIIAELTLEWRERDIRVLCRKKGLDRSIADAVTLAAVHLLPVTRPAWGVMTGEQVSGKKVRNSIAENMTALIDVSDGLASDLHNLCESSGVGAVIQEESLPVPSSLREIVPEDKQTEVLISSGEEYAHLAAVKQLAEEDIPPRGRVIGRFGGREDEIFLSGRDGSRRKLPRTGYQHRF